MTQRVLLQFYWPLVFIGVGLSILKPEPIIAWLGQSIVTFAIGFKTFSLLKP